MEKRKSCKECGEPSIIGRRLCQKCNLLRAKKYYSKEKRREKNKRICVSCGEEKYHSRKTQKVCGECWRKTISLSNVCNQYVYDKRGNPMHRVLAEKILGRKLLYNEVVHHINENPKDNRLENLMIMSRKNHGKLHLFLRQQRALLMQINNENQENCWDSLRVLQTTAWLETTSAKVKKLSELANQQPSLLTEEGSETMHLASLVDEDIVHRANL